MRRVSTVLATLAAMAVLLLPGTAAWAHNVLISSNPERDATLAQAPGAITLVFAQKLNPDFTTVVLSDAAKHPVAASKPQVNGTKATLEPSGPVGGGTYTVAYRVVSVDGHTVQGSYEFSVSGPNTANAPNARNSPVGLAASSSSTGASPATLIAIAGAAVMVLAIGAFLLLRGRRR